MNQMYMHKCIYATIMIIKKMLINIDVIMGLNTKLQPVISGTVQNDIICLEQRTTAAEAVIAGLLSSYISHLRL